MNVFPTAITGLAEYLKNRNRVLAAFEGKLKKKIKLLALKLFVKARSPGECCRDGPGFEHATL